MKTILSVLCRNNEYSLGLLFVLCLTLACKQQPPKQEVVYTPEQQRVVEFWEKFKEALEQANTSYLVEHATEMVQCDCGIPPDTTEWIQKEELFHQHLDAFVPPQDKSFLLSYDVYPEKEAKHHRIGYSFPKTEQAPGHNLFYMILEEEGVLKYEGLFYVP